MCDYLNMNFKAIEIPRHSAKNHSSAQVNADLYLISWAELAVKKVENLLDNSQEVIVK